VPRTGNEVEAHQLEANGNGSGVWKWIAAGLLSFMLVIASGTTATAIALLSTPNQSQVDQINERQQAVLQRLSAIDVLIVQNQEILRELQEDIEEEHAASPSRAR
jgi:uncharacterized protein YpmS